MVVACVVRDPEVMWVPSTGGFRMAWLHIDRETDVSLFYIYDPDEGAFQTIGHVRLHNNRLWEGMTHHGADTIPERDRFVRKVLVGLAIRPDHAEAVIRTAVHSRSTPSGVVWSSPVDRGSLTGATHPPARAPVVLGYTSSVGHGDELDGSHTMAYGLLSGLLLGVLFGWTALGWQGVVIGAFIGSSTFADLFPAGWQLLHARDPRNAVEIHDSLAWAMITLGSIAGAVGGYLIGGDGLLRIASVFLGMASVGLVLAMIATTFSMVPIRQWLMVGIGPLVVGALTCAAYAVSAHPISIAVGVLLGLVCSTIPTRLIDPERARLGR